MVKTGNYIFAYDISLNTERNKVDKVLKEYGFRVQKSVFECMLSEADVQKSVFECMLSEADRDKLIKRLHELDLKSGFVKVYKQEYNFKAVVAGDAPEMYETGGAYFAV